MTVPVIVISPSSAPPTSVIMVVLPDRTTGPVNNTSGSPLSPSAPEVLISPPTVICVAALTVNVLRLDAVSAAAPTLPLNTTLPGSSVPPLFPVVIVKFSLLVAEIAPAISTFPPLSKALPKLVLIVRVLISPSFTPLFKSTKSPEVVTCADAPLNMILSAPEVAVTTKLPSVL